MYYLHSVRTFEYILRVGQLESGHAFEVAPGH